MRNRIGLLAALATAVVGSTATATAQAPSPQGVRLDLAKAFRTRAPWRLVVTEGPPAKDYSDADAPGALTLCLHKGAAGPCLSKPVTPPPRTADDYPAWAPHYLFTAKPVYPRGPEAEPFLLIVTGSLNSGDGDQVVATQLLTYDAAQDAFRRVYAKSVGRNNNQEVRFVTQGPLRGSVITAEPQTQRPYGYWIEVERLTPAGTYRQALHYRSATLYGDGNPLAVIDSEMPNIQARLGLWKPGQPLPTPSQSGGAKPCPKPALRRSELWCD